MCIPFKMHAYSARMFMIPMYAFRVQTPTLTIGFVSMVQCISSEKLKNNQKRIFRNII